MARAAISTDDIDISNDASNVKFSNENISSLMCIDKPMHGHRLSTLLNQPLRLMAAVASMVPLDTSGTACHREAMATGRHHEQCNTT